MDKITLESQAREITGRKVKTLRAKGIVPAHVFGHEIKSENISVDEKEFKTIFHKAGETSVISLKVGGKEYPVLVKGLHLDPVTLKILHVDFYKVNLSEKVKVQVPVEIVGESEAVETKVGLLLTPVSEVEVEALPADLPEKIEVNIENLKEVGDTITIGDIKLSDKIEILSDAELVVASIGEFVTKEMEAAEAEAEAEAEAANEPQEDGQAEGLESTTEEGSDSSEEN
ncbi:50S ribosomal protein L25 [Candidatus Curtissbacteria bacterium]|nr:50S ribosomal protein L25 [Candidatus Curtissbacteria bacterium]